MKPNYYELYYEGQESETPFIIHTDLTKEELDKVIKRMKKIRDDYDSNGLNADADSEIIRELILRTDYEKYWKGLAHDKNYKEIEIRSRIYY